jgi:hypothetical protein
VSEDRRIFTPLARSSYAWKRVYQKRTAVERVNSRLDASFLALSIISSGSSDKKMEKGFFL